MRKLSCFSHFYSENFGHCVYREGAPEHDFIKADAGALKGKNWINEKGESTAEAKALAEKIQSETKALQEKTKLELAGLYDEVLSSLPEPDSFDMEEVVVGEKYKNKGLLAVLEGESALVRAAFQNNDLRLLAYGNIMKELENGGMDANYLPMGSKVSLSGGEVTVTYPDGKTAGGMLFPWDLYGKAKSSAEEVAQDAVREAEEDAKKRRESGAVQEEERAILEEEFEVAPERKTPEPEAYDLDEEENEKPVEKDSKRSEERRGG